MNVPSQITNKHLFSRKILKFMSWSILSIFLMTHSQNSKWVENNTQNEKIDIVDLIWKTNWDKIKWLTNGIEKTIEKIHESVNIIRKLKSAILSKEYYIKEDNLNEYKKLFVELDLLKEYMIDILIICLVESEKIKKLHTYTHQLKNIIDNIWITNEILFRSNNLEYLVYEVLSFDERMYLIYKKMQSFEFENPSYKIENEM